ncbi:MAG: Catabolite control protein A [Lentisphaerae bacterium ADurb.BinA184]|nr:MAG: Catabolite control protein A [Lentisphaerae bacterium ADurb.BinA184]
MTRRLKTVTDRLRRDIVSGRLAPGQRLPRRDELSRRYGVRSDTVQAAVRSLVDEGFVVVGARRHGSFVAERPPHLHRYKLLFPYDPGHRGEFWRVLRQAALRMGREGGREFSFFYGFGGHRGIESYRKLVEDVRAERVAGLIFASGGAEFEGTPILDQPGIPRVAVAEAYELPGIPKLSVDYASFFAKALAALAAQGRRRIAVLFGAGANDTDSPLQRAYAAAMARHRLAVHPLWTQFADVWSPLSARRIAHVLLHDGQRLRPDGLIVADDSFLPAATQGIGDAGVRVPGELSVVALANFPAGVAATVPVTRIGFDVDAMLDTLAGWIDQLRDGGRPPEFRKVPALSEIEYRQARDGDR